MFGCSQPAKVSTSNTVATPALPVLNDVKSYQINQTKVCGDLSVTVGEIKVENEKITVGVKVVNTSKNLLSFYPDQKNLAVGTRQLYVNKFLGEGKISGEIEPNTEKTGSIVYIDQDKKINPAGTKQIELHFGEVINTKSSQSVSCDLFVELK